MPLLIILVFCIEVLIYLWADWTSTFDRSNFFAIESEYIFDKCARIAGRISSVLFLIILSSVGFYGLKKIYADETKRDSFRVLITLFSVNHLIHFLFVILLFRNYGKSFQLDGPIQIGGPLHGFITYIFIMIVPFILWKYKNLNTRLYSVILLYLLNISSFIIKTFLSKVKPPEHPAYHNQFGALVLTIASFYMLYRVYIEYKRNITTND